jgi:quercetin dioxygenase-like cupin family protein
MNVQGKVWGFTSTLFEKNNVEVHRICCKDQSYCSKHRHNFKYNMFFIEKGSLEIHVWKNDYDLMDITVLNEHDSCIVKPGEYHLFKSLEEGTIAFEVYWVEIDSDDIIRDNVGGLNK